MNVIDTDPPADEVKPLVMIDSIVAAALYELKSWRSTLDSYPPDDRVALTKELLDAEIAKREPAARAYAQREIETLRKASAAPAAPAKGVKV